MFSPAVLSAFLQRRLPSCDGLLLAVSGGPDSMALLSAAVSISLPFPVAAVHVNHGLRAESDEEYDLVESFCRRNSVPFYGTRLSVREEREKGESIEQAARRLRYAYFASVSRQTGIRCLMTAHTADDQCETVLLHLLRGSGLRGLCGIRPVSVRDGMVLLRPLLETEKKDLIAYLEERHVSYATDRSNEDLRYTRNRIRHRLLPELSSYNPSVKDALLRAARSCLQAQETIEKKAAEFREASTDGALSQRALVALEPSVFEEVLYGFLLENGVIPDAEAMGALKALLQKETGNTEPTRGVVFHLGQGRLSRLVSSPPPQPTVLHEGENSLWNGMTLRLTRETATPKTRYHLLAASLPLVARTRRTGDVFDRPKVGEVRLKKRMIDAKIPADLRDRLPVLESDGRIVFVPGVGISTGSCPALGEDGFSVTLVSTDSQNPVL